MQQYTPIRIHPKNPKCFEFRGKPLVFVTATEHYGAILNRKFDFERYLADMADKRMTLTREFMLYREIETPKNPMSALKPPPEDYVAPYQRPGPGTATDGLPMFDLDRWNPGFFERLHRFIGRASELGIVVEVVLFSNTYNDRIWALNPLNKPNNINNVEEIKWQQYTTSRHSKLLDRQTDFARKIVEETNKYDNIFYEICNEAAGYAPGDEQNPSLDEVDQWQRSVAEVIRQAESKLPNKHLIAGQEALAYPDWRQSPGGSFRSFPVDIVNVHPLPGMRYAEKTYDMGAFESKQLKLRAVRDFCLATQREPKPLNLDEDNVANVFKDAEGWTIQRKRAWTTLFCGCHYDFIEFSILPGSETGSSESQRCVRKWFKHLSEFIHSADLANARPLTGLVKSVPPHTLESVLGVDGKDYCVYLADSREMEEKGCGKPITGEIVLHLPEGSYSVSIYSPVTGEYSQAAAISGGDYAVVSVPEFVHDTVVRIKRSKAG